MTGYTLSGDFPTTPGAFDTTLDFGTDVFVTKLNPNGSAPLDSTYLGGSGNDLGYGVAVDGTGNAYVTGHTQSEDFPTTPGAFDTTYAGGNDVFVTKINPSGSAPLLYSTYLGGSSYEVSAGLAVDGTGSAYVTGYTVSGDFPTTPGAFDTTFNGGFDVFVTKLNPIGSAPLFYSTYVGGSSEDRGIGVAVDGTGSAYVTGYTDSADFPTTLGAFDTTLDGSEVFVTKLNPSGSAPLLYSTYVGGSSFEFSGGIAVDGTGSAVCDGLHRSSGDFPTTPGAFDTTFNGGTDVFVTKLNPSGSAPLLYSTILGLAVWSS